MKGSLVHKIFLLALIPLCFEIGIFSMLLNIQQAQQQEAARINKLRLIGDTLNKVTGQIFELEGKFQHFESPLVAASAVTKTFRGLDRSFEDLAKLTEDDSEKHAIALAGLREIRQAKKDLDQLMAAVVSNQSDDIKAIGRSFRPRFHDHLQRAIDSGLLKLSTATAAEIDTDKTAAIREKEIALLKIALIGSLLVALGSAWMLSKYVVSKLKTLSRNAELLSRREKLLPPIAGGDELAVVDGAMHRAASEISRLELAREEMMGMVSHDIRNPLSSIKFAADAMLNGADNSAEDTSYYLGSITSNCDRILSISTDLLDLQKLESGTLTLNLEVAELGDCIEAAVQAVEAVRVSRDVKITTDIESGGIPVTVDKTKIEQVLINLISNAIKFSPKGSTVAVSAIENNGGVSVSVQDEGKGIPPELLGSVFDRFVQNESENYRAKGSVGLGLAICKGLIHLHHGKIEVCNADPRGCIFTFFIPQRQSDNAVDANLPVGSDSHG